MDANKNKKVVYTCITGGYDTLIEPSVVTEGFDYVCFTDCTNIESKTWEIRQLPKEIKELNTTNDKKKRAIKILPHRYLSEMVQSNIIVRRHNSENCIRLMEQWRNELYNGSHRDQLSFNYVLWKNPDIKITLLPKSIYNSEFFFWGRHKANEVLDKVARGRAFSGFWNSMSYNW